MGSIPAEGTKKMRKIIFIVLIVIFTIPAIFIYLKVINVGDVKKDTVLVASKFYKDPKINQILSGERSNYENLPPPEKVIVESYYKLIENSLNLETQSRNNLTSISGCILKYYSSEIALILCTIEKPSLSFNIYDIKNNKIITANKDTGENILSVRYSSGYLELESYMFSVNENTITYFKRGELNFKTLTNSKLGKDEAYVKINGKLDEFEYSFDAKNNRLEVSVFKKENKIYESNIKLREISFELP